MIWWVNQEWFLCAIHLLSYDSPDQSMAQVNNKDAKYFLMFPNLVTLSSPGRGRASGRTCPQVTYKQRRSHPSPLEGAGTSRADLLADTGQAGKTFQVSAAIMV